MKSTLSRMCIAMLLLLGACKYEPTDSNFQDIAPPSTNPGIGITVLNPTGSNVLRGKPTLSYTTLLNGHYLRGIDVFLNGAEVDHATGPNGTFTIETSGITDGEYTLRIVLYASTNTGSLADKIDAERYVITRDYSVTVFNAPMIQPQIGSMVLTGDVMKLDWALYWQPGFKRYIVRKNGNTLAVITNQNENSFDDSSYFGGGVYQVETDAVGVELMGDTRSTGAVIEYPFTATLAPDNTIHLHWPPCRYPRPFLTYELVRDLPGTNDGPTIQTFTNLNDTTYIDQNPPFGGQVQYELFAKSQSLETSYDHGYARVSGIGEVIPKFPASNVQYFPGKNQYLVFTQSHYFTVYDGNTMAVVATTLPSVPPSTPEYRNFAVSESGAYLYGIEQFANGKITRRDFGTLVQQETIDLEVLGTPPLGPVYSIGVSNSNVAAAMINWTGSVGTIAVIDLNTKTVRTRKDIRVVPAVTPEYVYISPDSRWIMGGNMLFEFKGDSLRLVGDIPVATRFSNDPAYLVSTSGSALRTLRCSDLAITKELVLDTAPAKNSFWFDPATGLVGFERGEKMQFEVYDMESGIRKASVPLVAHLIAFQNGTLIANGYRLPLHLN